MSSESTQELDELIARLADGDRSAFTPAFRLLWPPALRLCRSMLKNDADAADAAQQAMQKILERASEYDRGRAALPGALAITSWECRSLLRKRSRRHEVGADLAQERPSTEPTLMLERRELVQAAMQVLGELSTTDRETLIATFQNEASASSVGERWQSCRGSRIDFGMAGCVIDVAR